MKQILLSLAVVFGMQASTQTIDTIVTIDTTITIDTVTTVDTVMLINKTDSTVVSIPISEIDSVTFDENTTTNYSYTYTYDTTVTYDTLGACNGLTSITYNGYDYDLVEIGNQCWFKENLQTTMYRDSTPIDYPGTDNTLWGINTTGAYAWYDDDSSAYASTYGALYNWYAVDNSAGLCPAGWHVPSDSTWTVLENYLEGNGYNYDGTTTGNKYAKAMADTTVGWNHTFTVGAVGYNTNFHQYRNKSGFSGKPCSYRNKSGGYGPLADSGVWWSSTQYGTGHALYRFLRYLWVDLGSNNIEMDSGYSVRCIKD